MLDFHTLKNSIIERFPNLSDEYFREDGTRLWVKAVLPQEFITLFDFVVKELRFDNFHMTVGLDSGDYFEIIYLLSNAENQMLNLRQRTVSRDDTFAASVYPYFENALFHERELIDLFGIDVQGLPAGHRYPLPDKWPDDNYPLRKDWKTEFFDKKTLTYDHEAAAEAERLRLEEEARKKAAREAAIAAAKAKKAQQEKEAQANE
ncbi:MAG: NADH-quinone oxidoreductase subunit C [Firmicutes bacterium]|nr:NADH-quinone oxidoreductase subunit C [Bacillota bacterium]